MIRSIRYALALLFLPKDMETMGNMIASCAGTMLTATESDAAVCEWEYRGVNYKWTCACGEAIGMIREPRPRRAKAREQSNAKESVCAICTNRFERGPKTCPSCGSSDLFHV